MVNNAVEELPELPGNRKEKFEGRRPSFAERRTLIPYHPVYLPYICLFFWLVVSTHLKNMLVKMGIFSK